MLRHIAIGVMTSLFVLTGISNQVHAGPLRDFAANKIAIDVNYKPNLDLGSTEEKHSNYDFGITTSLSDKYALQYRNTHFHTDYAASTYKAIHHEANVYYKLDNNLQAFAGYYTTKTSDKITSTSLPDHHGFQAGLLGFRDLNKRSYIYGILSAGSSSAVNVEFGLTYKLSKQWEANATYRHLSIENIGPQKVMDNLRGFGFGFTYKY